LPAEPAALRTDRPEPVLLARPLPHGATVTVPAEVTTPDCTCEWSLDVVVKVGGEHRHLSVDDGGRPFRSAVLPRPLGSDLVPDVDLADHPADSFDDVPPLQANAAVEDYPLVADRGGPQVPAVSGLAARVTRSEWHQTLTTTPEELHLDTSKLESCGEIFDLVRHAGSADYWQTSLLAEIRAGPGPVEISAIRARVVSVADPPPSPRYAYSCSDETPGVPPPPSRYQPAWLRLGPDAAVGSEFPLTPPGLSLPSALRPGTSTVFAVDVDVLGQVFGWRLEAEVRTPSGSRTLTLDDRGQPFVTQTGQRVDDFDGAYQWCPNRDPRRGYRIEAGLNPVTC
jgi:hypothetical protein